MSTSGAISGVAFSFSYALVKASSPTEFFTGSFTAGDVKVVKRTGSTTATSVNITTLPTHKYEGVFQFDLSASEMTADEVVVVINAASADVVDEAISIVTETSTADVRKVAGSLVSGTADFKATGFSTFDPAADTVANVTTVGSVSGSVGSVVAAVTAGTVSDKTGYSITGTLQTLDALDTAQDSQHSTTQSAISGLNDIAATDIVSGGAITTSGGAVSNVTLVATTTTNADMRGTDNAASQASVNTVDTEVGQIKAKTDQLAFTVANQVDANALTGGGGDATAANQTSIINHLTDVKGAGWTSTDNLAEITEDVTGLNGDAMRGTDGASTTTPPTAAAIYSEFTSGSNENAFKADVSSLATSAEVSALNNLSSSDVAAAVWNAAYASYNTAGSFGKLMDIIRKSNLTIEGAVAGTGTPTTTEFHTNLTYVDDAFDEQILLFVSGALEGESRPINRNFQLNGRVVLDEAFTSPPTSGDEFVVLPEHIHSLASISDSILSRDVDNVEATLNEHTLGTIILCILESVRTGTTWTIRRTDGATTHVTKTLTLDATADPVTGVD